MADPLDIIARVERWPIAGTFTISRGSKTEAAVLVVEARAGGHVGRGEAVPYARYSETPEGCLAAVAGAPRTLDREALRATMPAGAARNAIDCALLDLEARRTGRPVCDILGLTPPGTPVTCYTLSLAGPDAMAARAREVAHLPLLKLKLGGGATDRDRMFAVRAARPDARIVADANEAWSPDDLPELLAAAAEARLELVEQPLPAGTDAALAAVARPVPVCADESVHTREDLARIATLYDAVNIKLDKAGGLTEAAAMQAEAKALGLRVMLGCMVATSLAMAPARLLAGGADWVDLDGPLLLARDRDGGLSYSNGIVGAPAPGFWG